MMKTMSSKEIKDRYGAFAEAARREPIVHTSHGRRTLVTISIDRALTIPELREDLGAAADDNTASRLQRLLAMAGVGETIAGPQSPEQLNARSKTFRGNE